MIAHTQNLTLIAKSWVSLCFSMALLSTAPLSEAAEFELLSQTTVDQEALTFADGDETNFGNFPNGITHQQHPIETYRGYQYAVYYDDNRHVCVGRRKLPAGEWDIIRLTDYDYESNDTHNVAVLGICKNDGTIHLTFDHHVSNLNYRKSIAGVANDPEAFTWSPSLFGSVTDTLGPIGTVTQVTYPRFISMPNGNLMLYYRFITSGNGDSVIRVYDGDTSEWTTSHGTFIARDNGTFTFDGEDSEFRYAYINGISYGGDRLHCSWIWRDRFSSTDVNNQHDLCYAYSDDDGLTWNNSAGTQIATTGSSAIDVNSTGLIVHAIDPNTGLANQNTQFAYPDGGIHVILPRYRDGTTSVRYYHHHWRDVAGNWHSEDMGVTTASRPELFGDEQRNLFMIHTSGDDLRILKGIPNADLTDWTWSLIYNADSPSTAGDGQVDPSRWLQEGVISVYHQEEPSSILDYGSDTVINGLPTPLHVTDFQVSSKAAQPNPSHLSAYVPEETTLQWSAGINTVSHRIYIGTDASTVSSATITSPEYMGQQAGTTFTPSAALANDTTYHWRIDQVEADSVVRTGLLWSFTTGGNLPPTIKEIADQESLDSSPVVISITISDDQTALGNLTLGASSSDTALIPNSSIAFSGNDANRTATITPATGMSGSCTITMTVSDGSLTGETSFDISVGKPVEDLTMIVLGTNSLWTDAATWSDALPAHADDHYTAPPTGKLISPDGDSQFPGTSLTIESTASLQVRSRENLGTSTIVEDLILRGGASYSPSDYAELIAGTANDDTNVIDGNILASGFIRLRGYAGSNGDNPRNFRVLSEITGSGTIQSHASGVTSLHTCFIDNLDNTFSGTWQSARGSFEFASAEAIGSASITVVEHGELTILGDWNQSGATLSADDSADIAIHIGGYDWTVTDLTLGTISAAAGTYTIAQLNALSNAVFTGTGTLTVGTTQSALEGWRYLHFGTIENAGTSADMADSDLDGESNLLEFATAQDPHAATLVTTPVEIIGDDFGFHYTRSKDALADGMIFTVEWSASLEVETWSTLDITETANLENPGDSETENRIVKVSLGSEEKYFVRLKVIKP